MSANATQHRVFRFGEFSLNTARGVLLKNGDEVKLRPQSFQVLQLLLDNCGNLVSKDDLHDRVWGQKAVTDDSLAQCLIDIRKALGDTDRRIVRTVPRRGYVFDDSVIVEDIDTAAPTPRLRSRAIGLGIAAAVMVVLTALLIIVGGRLFSDRPMQQSIAVLAFADLSEDQKQKYLGDGLSEDVLIALGQHPELRVIARTSSFSFAGQSRDIASISEVLNVTYVLEGSVRRTGDQLRVTAQLIETSDSTNVWSDSFDLPYEELPELPARISGEVIAHILPDSNVPPVTVQASNIMATDLLLLARHAEQQVRESADVDQALLQRSIDLYRSAVQSDPQSALAHSRLARVLVYDNDMPGAEISIGRALELNPDLSEVQDTLARYRWLRGEPGAGDAWLRAIELNPSNVDAISSFGFWTWMQGDGPNSEVYFRRAIDLDPLSLSRYADLGNFIAKGGKIDETLELIHQIEGKFNTVESLRVVARLYDLIGQVETSIALTIQARDRDSDNPLHRWALAELYADIGDYATAQRLEPEPGVGLLLKMGRIDEAIDLAQIRMIEEPEDVYLRYLLAFAYNAKGQAGEAIRILRSTDVERVARPEARQAIDTEAYLVLADALHAVGENDKSHEMAEWWYTRLNTVSANWWRPQYTACAFAIQGRDTEALDMLERIKVSPRLPWMYLLEHSRCFQRFAGDPRYQAVLDQVAARRTQIRARLPSVLEAHGVAL